MALSDAKLRSLKPKEKPYKVADAEGLFVLVNPTGSKLWRFKYRLDKREKLLSFGAYPDISLEDARALKRQARSNVEKSIDPSVLKKEAKLAALGEAENTSKAIAAQYVAKKEKEGRAEATLKKIKWVLDMANADFGHMKIIDVTAPIVLKTLRKREKQGHYETAKRMRSIIGAVFRYAIASGLTDNDPTFALKDALISPTVTHRAAITDKTELRKLMASIDAYNGQTTTKIALKLLMLFSTRPGELRQARWNEFDFENKVWNIPAERMKMRKPHSVPLSGSALELLSELKRLTGWGELLFPSNTSSKKPISENTLNQALRRMGYGADKVTSHGFRAGYSTIANDSGLWKPDAIERALGHLDTNSIRRAYDRGQHWGERVKMAEWWAGILIPLK